ncbi:MAG: DUF1801 domain-containing protein [Phycisphaerales bacterium]|nr:DUF1801 domain-containing protein [Phycisphaerales bacterium]MCB9836718.1 DUF1801 domain-containing protein [Phycisphaera sp.]
MSAKKKAPASVDELLEQSEHPLLKDIQRVRKFVLGVDKRIEEGVKWNGPSYRLGGDFATVHMREAEDVCFILHTGAKKRAKPLKMRLADPSGLVEWLAQDRCLVRLGSGKTLTANRKAFEAILREWIGQLPES